MKRSLRNYGNSNTPNKPKNPSKENQQPQSNRNAPDTSQYQNDRNAPDTSQFQNYQNMPDVGQFQSPLNGIDANTANVFQNVLSQYGNKSEDELLSELKLYQQSGMMDMQSLYDMANRIAPMLNPQQMQKLSHIIQELSGK